MKTLDKGLWSGYTVTSQLWKAQRWILLVLLLTGLWAGAAQADVLITSITQDPQNPVSVETPVTYQVTVSYPGGVDPNASININIIEDGFDVSSHFTPDSSCIKEGSMWCTPGQSNTDIFTMTWTPPTSGTHNLNFIVSCGNDSCPGNAQSITTIVGTSDLPPQPPIANAGPDQSVTDTNNDNSEAVTLDGSGSNDANGDIVSYEWFIGETRIGTGTVITTNLSVGTHTIELIVTDSMQNTSSDNVQITINSDRPSQADAGADQTITATNSDGTGTVTLDGSNSYVINYQIQSYEWLENGTSLGTGANLSVNLAEGEHTITLRVLYAGGEGILEDDVIITVISASSDPVANAGPDQTVIDINNDGLETVTLDGSSSTDVNNVILDYVWWDAEGEGVTYLGKGKTLDVELVLGTHHLALEVYDSQGNSLSSDQVIITVNPNNQIIDANAGPDQNVIDSNNDGFETVTLDGSGSTLTTNNNLIYDWYEGDVYHGEGETLEVELAVGTHDITLIVTDNDTPYEDSVIITVQKPASSTSEPSIEILSGANQRLSEGSSSDPLSIRAIGPDGQPLEGVTVTWTVIPTDAATITSDTSTTDTNGESSNIVTLTASRIPGTFQVRAALPSGTSARFQVNPLAGISGLTPAQRSVANALDNACPSLQQLINSQEGGTTQQESLLDTCNDLASASDQEIISALQQFLPVEVAAQGRNSISLARIRNKNILLRLNALRSGASGPSFENISVSIQGEQLPSVVISELTKSRKGGAASADSIASPLGVFVNGNISIGDTETTENEAGFDFETNGLTMGVDYRYSDQFVLGGALNYISTNSDYLSRSSTLDIDGYSLSLYGSYYQSEQVFIDSILSIGLNNYDSQREFTTGGINHDLKGDTDGAEYAFSLGGGYEFNYQNLSFVPQARVNYLRVKVDSYDETSSGSGLNLSIDDQDIESLITSISGNLSLAYSTQYGVFIPYLSIEWAHEFENDSRAIIAHFVNDPTKTNFSVLTDDPDQDYLFLGLGVSAAMANGKSAFLHYEQMLDHADTSQYTVTAGFRLEF